MKEGFLKVLRGSIGEGACTTMMVMLEPGILMHYHIEGQGKFAHMSSWANAPP